MCIIETDDSLDSINATTSAIVKYVSQKQALESAQVVFVLLVHLLEMAMQVTQVLFLSYKMFQAATVVVARRSKNGAATLYYPIWHLEVEDLLVLKNNKGTEDNRVRHMDYGVQFNKLMYERLTGWQILHCFSHMMFLDYMMLSLQTKTSLKNYTNVQNVIHDYVKRLCQHVNCLVHLWKSVKTQDAFTYMNVDHANTHGRIYRRLAPIKQVNLCCEINYLQSH